MSCIVLNCEGKHSVKHIIPKCLSRRRIWLEALNREDLLLKSYDKVRNLKVCGDHFHLRDYCSPRSLKLNRNAVPIKIYNTSQNNQSITSQNNRTSHKGFEIMPRKTRCVVNNCLNPKKPFHFLPKNPELRNKWLYNVCREDLRDVSYVSICHSGVCSLHFNPSQYCYSGSTRLLRTAVPVSLQPEAPSKTNNILHEDIIDELINDAPIATGEVTAPLLCDNKVLRKTKSTYSKNKYKMTFTEEETDNPNKSKSTDDLPIIFEGDEEAPTSNIDIDPLILTPTKSINDANATNSKKRKYDQIESGSDKYDGQLYLILQEVKSLPNFLDIIFGFLYRRTDYFQIPSESNTGGLPSGMASKLLWKAFKNYESKSEEERVENVEEQVNKISGGNQVNKIISGGKNKTSGSQVNNNKNVEVQVVNKKIVGGQVVNKKNVGGQVIIKKVAGGQVSNKKILDKSSAINTISAAQLFKTYNGAVFENYAWSQSVSDVDIQIKIPDKISCKQLEINITATQLLIKLRDSPSVVYLKGDLCKTCKMSESVWSLGGQILQIHLEKLVEGWWDCLLKAEPRLDFNKMNFLRPRPFCEVSAEIQPKIENFCDEEVNGEDSYTIIWKDEFN